MSRFLVIALFVAVVYVLSHTSITLPALSVVGLAVWAMFATAVACTARRAPRRQLRRYRTPAGVLS